MLVLLTGCTIDRLRICSAEGNRVIEQQTHSVHLSLVRPVHYGNVYAFPEDLTVASKFAFSFIGKTNQITVVHVSGNYQYKNRPIQPLELTYSTSSNAVFQPKPDCIENGWLRSGQYNINIFYTVNGQNFTGNFQVYYKVKTKIRWIFFWDFYRMPT
jgi:hypothetical protein